MKEFNYDENKAKETFESFTSYTEQDRQNVMNNKDKIIDIMRNTKVLGPLVDNVITLFDMLVDTFSRKYKEIPGGAIVGIICSLAYLLCPQDFIPDYIPVFGYVDDAAVLRFCLQCISHDIEKYKIWKKGSTIKLN